MDWSQVTALTIPEGNVKQVSVNGVVLWKKGLLPVGYTQLEYIESTGTQYIDTGVVNWNNTLEYEIKLSIQQQSGIKTYFGCYDGWNTSKNNVPNISTWTKYKVASNFRAGYSSSSGTDIGIIDGQTGTISLKGNTISWSEGSSSSFNRGYDFTVPFSIFLFAQHSENNTTELATTKIYYAKFWLNGELFRNFIPVMRNSDSKVGMYDTVTRQFFTNAGTGEFIAGPRFVEYIEFDGNSWIDTGITQQTCRIECGVEFINHNNAAQFMGFHASNTGFWGIARKGSKDFYPFININPYQYNDVIINFDATNTTAPVLTLTIGDATSSRLVGNTVNPKTTYVMGGIKSGSTINSNNFMKVYYNRIYNANNELIQDLRPCLDSNNVACMYDMVTGAYFYNQGTGEFQYGGIL